MGMPPRTRPRWIPASPAITAARWLDMLACGVVAGSAVLLLLALLARPLAALLAATLGPWTPQKAAVLLLAGSVVAMALLWRHGKGRWGAMVGVRHWCAYPGVAAASGFGALGAAFVLRATGLDTWGLDAAVMTRPPAWAWFVFASVLIVPPAVEKFERWRRWKARNHKNAAESSSPFPADQSQWTFEHWRDWSASDKEIHFKGDDRFDAKPIADRIAGRLVPDESKNEQPSIALIGPKGSGKSSILSLVERDLANEKNIEFARIRLWAYDTPEAAMRGVLDRLIEAVGRHAPTLALTGLPGEYLAAVDHMAGRWGVLRLLSPLERDPLNLLKKIDRIAAAVGVRFVLAIEDFERFREGHADASSLGPIRALLYQLDQCEHVTVVMASDDLDDRFDMEKIARYVERVPTVTAKRVASMLDQFRSACMRVEPLLIDPGEVHRLDFNPSIGKRMALDASHGERALLVEEAAVVLAGTPRTLKLAVRRACDFWKKLPGEIDIDELLVLSVLKACAPEVYAAFSKDDILTGLRGYCWNVRHDKEPGGSENMAHSKLQAAIKKARGDERQEAVWRLVVFLFPGVPPALGKRPPNEERAKGPQCIGQSEPTDFLRRFDAIPHIDADRRDQTVLRSIDAWKAEDPGSDLVRRMMDPETAPLVVHFADRLTPEAALRLLEGVVIAECRTGSIQSSGIRLDVGLAAMKQVFYSSEAIPPGQELLDVIERVLPTAVESNIPLAEELLRPLTGTIDGRGMPIDQHRCDRLPALATMAFARAFPPDNYDALERAMRGSTTCWPLLDLLGRAWPLADRAGASKPKDIDARVKLEAIPRFLMCFAEHNHRYGPAALAWFIAPPESGKMPTTDRLRGASPYTAEVKEAAIEWLFDRQRLIKIYRRLDLASSDLDNADRIAIQAAINWANAQPDPHPQEPPE